MKAETEAAAAAAAEARAAEAAQTATEAQETAEAEAEAAAAAAAAAAAMEVDGASSGASESALDGDAAMAAVKALAETAAAAELESQKLMNDELMKELEANAASLDELNAMNARLLQQNQERDDVNRVLMTKARQLREVKDSESTEREALAVRLQHAETARARCEDLLRDKERFVEEAGEQRRLQRAASTEREREASAAVEAALELRRKMDELREEADGHRARSDTAASRLSGLTEECRQLRATRDELEEALEEKGRRLDRAAKKLEKERGKQQVRKSELGGSKEADEDAEYREALEFELDELKKMVRACVRGREAVQLAGRQAGGLAKRHVTHSLTHSLTHSPAPLSPPPLQVNCPIIKEKPKTCMLVKCGHTFSRECIDKRISDRMRRCPTCNKSFAADDVKPIYLTS